MYNCELTLYPRNVRQNQSLSSFRIQANHNIGLYIYIGLLGNMLHKSSPSSALRIDKRTLNLQQNNDDEDKGHYNHWFDNSRRKFTFSLESIGKRPSVLCSHIPIAHKYIIATIVPYTRGGECTCRFVLHRVRIGLFVRIVACSTECKVRS